MPTQLDRFPRDVKIKQSIYTKKNQSNNFAKMMKEQIQEVIKSKQKMKKQYETPMEDNNIQDFLMQEENKFYNEEQRNKKQQFDYDKIESDFFNREQETNQKKQRIDEGGGGMVTFANQNQFEFDMHPV